MILTSHALVGAAIASLFPQSPILGFSGAFISHFMLDAIPHWDYPLKSDSINPSIGSKIVLNKPFFIDTITIGGDIVLGLLLSLVIFNDTPPWIIILGASGGILPDPLQFVYTRFKREPFITLQKFHAWIQRDNNFFKDKQLAGVILQIATITSMVCILKLVGSLLLNPTL